ncbi:unnamed protein product [Paramecium octaurelia]|uniref:Uncharacterized protein n=1 Tax=Paramecium octaurelia TaxID=43137 RepID=A0A8S1UFU1_PAROT|nr:unnamed protein product [Paramecium octaurelia]
MVEILEDSQSQQMIIMTSSHYYQNYVSWIEWKNNFSEQDAALQHQLSD